MNINDTSLVTHLTSATLPLLGAYTTQDATALPYDAGGAHAKRVSCVVTYAKGAAAATGQVRLRPRWTLSGGTEADQAIVDVGAVTPAEPFGGVRAYQMTIDGPRYTTNGSFIVTLEVPAFATAFRLLACEIGDAANPGTCAIQVNASSVL